MKSLTALWSEVAQEWATVCCTSATVDIQKMSLRVEHEGLSYLTITLPQFGKDFERSLELGLVGRKLFQGYTWRAGLPRFLGGFLDQVFNRGSGVLLDEPSIDAIRAIRQLTLMYGKIELPCTNKRRSIAMDSFIQCEKELRESDLNLPCLDDFHRISRMLYARIYNEVDRKVYRGDLVPKHGPGATADRLRGNAKFRHRTWPSRLEEYFPFGEMTLPNWRFYDQYRDVEFLEPGDEIPVKVISVPKTLKTPRIIAVEPTAMQYAQQAIYSDILDSLQRDPILYNLIGFDDQTPNQRLAREGSYNGSLATLDLSEASDRVSNQLVRKLLVDHVHLHDAVDACRSRKADVDGHGVIRLAKFASMGSALCFPFEAMVFLTVILIGIEKGSGHTLSHKDLKSLVGRVRVYGDDIVVPVEYVQAVVGELETFGFLVNSSKSFWNGKFRESCGKEYYDGHDVCIVRVRSLLPARQQDADEVISTVSLRNQMYFSGMWRTTKWLDQYISGKISHFPTINAGSPIIGRESFLAYSAEKLHPTLHSPLVKGYVVRSPIPVNSLDEEPALYKCLDKLERANPTLTSTPKEEARARRTDHSRNLPVSDPEHLLRSGRPSVVNIKLRWARPY